MGRTAGAIASLRVNTPLRIEITDDARVQITTAATWWAEHRPATPGAVLEDLDRILGLLCVQPTIGTRARRANLSGVRRVTLFRIRYYVYYRSRMTPFKFLRCGTPVAVWGQAFERPAAEHGLQPSAADAILSRRG